MISNLLQKLFDVEIFGIVKFNVFVNFNMMIAPKKINIWNKYKRYSYVNGTSSIYSAIIFEELMWDIYSFFHDRTFINQAVFFLSENGQSIVIFINYFFMYTSKKFCFHSMSYFLMFLIMFVTVIGEK